MLFNGEDQMGNNKYKINSTFKKKSNRKVLPNHAKSKLSFKLLQALCELCLIYVLEIDTESGKYY